MNIITLFLALFLAFLPEGAPALNYSQGQDVFLEEVVDVEEEAILSSSRRINIRVQIPLITVPRDYLPSISQVFISVPNLVCLERQWLFSCSLRL